MDHYNRKSFIASKSEVWRFGPERRELNGGVFEAAIISLSEGCATFTSAMNIVLSGIDTCIAGTVH